MGHHLLRGSLVVVVVLSSACLTTSPKVPANGATLNVKTESWDTHTYRTLNRDAQWETNKLEAGSRFDGLFQGGDEVDELDFYAIAGEQKNVDRIVKWREQVNTGILINTGLATLGTGIAGAGLAMYAIDNQQPEAERGGVLRLGAFGAFTVGLAGVGFAIYAASDQFWGPKERLTDVEDGHPHLLPLMTAVEASQNYNARLRGEAPPPAPEPSAPASDEAAPSEPSTDDDL